MTNQRIKTNLRQAVAIMRAAVEDADRRSITGDAYAIRQVLHALQWGMVNASSSIECALAETEKTEVQE